MNLNGKCSKKKKKCDVENLYFIYTKNILLKYKFHIYFESQRRNILTKQITNDNYQRCQLLRITRSHYGKLQKFSVFYGLRKTRIFLREHFKKSSNQKC